jgi:thioredoxin reductase (NADPH)
MNKTDALIIGAGPTGLFTAHQLKLIGLNCEIVDNLDKIGGQCIELYPDKPIYDIPAVPECTGEELTNNLINQLKPFDIQFHLSERVDEVKRDNENWIVKTNKGKIFSTPNVIIAGGVGSFEPRKFGPKECEKFENKSLFYSVKDKIKELEKSGKIKVFTKFQLDKVYGSNNLESIDIKNDDGHIKKLETNYLLGFFGLIMQLGPIANWGLNIDKKTIEVDTEKFETNQKGIYAIGDICNYPGKLKLILSGFHEGALAARACFKLARPNEKYRFEFTTTSSNLLKRLGKKE